MRWDLNKKEKVCTFLVISINKKKIVIISDNMYTLSDRFKCNKYLGHENHMTNHNSVHLWCSCLM